MQRLEHLFAGQWMFSSENIKNDQKLCLSSLCNKGKIDLIEIFKKNCHTNCKKEKHEPLR